MLQIVAHREHSTETKSEVTVAIVRAMKDSLYLVDRI